MENDGLDADFDYASPLRITVDAASNAEALGKIIERQNAAQDAARLAEENPIP